MNRQTSETNALGHSRSWSYDAANNVTEYADRLGRFTRYTYDVLHRPTQEEWVANDGNTVVNTIDTTYDSQSFVTSISDDLSAYSFMRDPLGRVLSIDNFGTPGVPNVTLNASLDPNGNRTQLTADIIGVSVDFRNDYTYDALDNLIRRRIDDNGSIEYAG